MARRMTRREFLASSALAGAGLALARTPLSTAAETPLAVKVSGAGVPGDLAAAVEAALKPLGGIGAFVKKGQTVMLKPNMGFPTPPAQRATTSPELVKAVARLALDAGAKRVTVIDNPVRRPEACLELVGIKQACDPLGVKTFLPTSEKLFVEKGIPRGVVLKKTDVFREALEVDVHIALPIAKSHMATGYSGTLKGMMGLILDRESFHSRFDINQAIADLNTLLRANLVILDGLSVMTTDGPAGPGELVTCNAIVAGTDPVAVDALGVKLAPLYGRNVKPTQVKHLLAAEKLGVGAISPPAGRILEVTL